MIRYSLTCDSAHGFESWFAGADAFERLAGNGLVSCPSCGSIKVERAVMAPHVARTDRAPARLAGSAPVETPAPVVLMGEQERELREKIAALHRHVTETAEAVGPRFAEEALKIHHGEAESRAIYGQATVEEARQLHEEGVGFLPLPRLPDSGN